MKKIRMMNECKTTNGEHQKISRLWSVLTIICCLVLPFITTGCPDQLEMPGLANEEMAIVRIYIGENNSSARTIQPSRSAIAGYQLTFSGPSSQEPINITDGNSANVLLANGIWVITAKAYRLGGVIGNVNDEIASGSITVNITGGIIIGTVPSIILTPSGDTGNGILNYSITVGAGVSGYMKLWGIDGVTPVNTFGINGILNLSNTVASNFSHTAGRYIAEVRLENGEGKVAFHREVIEIWRGTTTSFIFIPAVFYDPSYIPANFGDFNITSNNPSMIIQSEGLVTITGDGSYIISMREGLANTTAERIVVVPDVSANITLTSVNIDRGGSNNIAFNMAGATVNLTLIGDNVLRSGGGAGLNVPEGSTLAIMETSTGSLTATSNWWSNSGAGIGGSGNNLTGGSISINGGTITATGSGSHSSISGSINTINGNAVVFASSISTLPTGGNIGPAIVFVGNNGTMYGNVILARNATIPSGRNLYINNGQTLTIQNGFTLTNNGTILVADGGNISGTVAGNQPIQHSFTVSGSLAYTYTGGVLTIIGNGTFNIGMRSGVTSTTAERIVVTPGVIADITLSSVNINRSNTGNAAFDMTGATVYLTLAGNNILSSGSGMAGLQAPAGSTLVIMGASTGSLSATGGSSGAGIGGGSGNAGGNISINGGTITANGGSSGTGIGGGWNGLGGTINMINGNAVVFASSIQPVLPIGGNIGPAIVFIGNNGTMYGNVTLARNVTIPSGRNLFITNGNTLTIQTGFTLTNNGTIFIENGNVSGTVAGNQPVEPSFTISGSSAYTYTEGVLTITGNGTYNIGMRSGVTSTTAERIVVSSGVTASITLSNVNIDRGGSNNIAFSMAGATVNLTLTGNNVLRSGGGAGLHVPEGSTLTIMGASTGSLTATSSWNFSSGAGIGGSSGSAGGTININGGTITATGTGTGNTSGIGGTINTINGNAVVFASSIQSNLPTGGNIGPAIVFNGNNGIMYGNVSLARNVTFPSGRNLFINNGQTLTIQSGSTLTNNGTILVADGGNVSGTITGNQPVSLSFTISGGSAFTYTGGVLTITGNGTYSIGMRSGVTSTTAERIVVASGITADIILSNVNINVSGTSNVCAFDMTGANVNLTLVGDNVLRSGSGRAGLQAPGGSTLVIMGASTGSLSATGGSDAAGIGGGSGASGGTISINGGTITATGSRGIGGGWNGSGGTINTINGNAVVFASSIQPDLPTGNNIGPAIVFIGNNGTMYGNVTLARNITIPSGRELIINNGQTLLILSSFTLTNNGLILVNNGGYVSGTVAGNQPVSSEGLIIVAMWDSHGDGWDGAGALRININGTDLTPNAKAIGSGSNYYFNVSSGDLVNFFWIAGTHQNENAFAVYFADDPPNPPFNPNSSNWSSASDPYGKVLLFRQYNTMNNIAGGTLLGSFTVP